MSEEDRPADSGGEARPRGAPPAGHGPGGVAAPMPGPGPSAAAAPGRPALPQRGVPAFAAVRARGLVLWTIVGALGLALLAIAAEQALGITVPGDLEGLALYLPMVGWIWFAVVRRAGVDLSVMFRWPRLGGYWGIVVGVFMVQFLFSAGASILVALVLPDIDDALVDVGRGNLAAALIGVVLLPAFVEETVFRGVLVERWTVKWRLGVAVVVSAVAFGLLHVDPVGAGVFGVVTALLYVRTGSLWPGILIHAANNLLALVLNRTADPAAVVAEPTAGEAVTAAATLIVFSAPFLAWFIRANWPARNQPTPYLVHEGIDREAVAPLWVSPVLWSGAPGPVAFVVGADRLEIRARTPGAEPFAVLPRSRLAAAYPAAAPHGMVLVLLAVDGTWTTIDVGGGDPSATRALAAAIGAGPGLPAGQRW